jgi:hypothetical protein
VLRYAQPFGKWLMRASLPFLRVPTGPNTTQSGMGDADVFFAYLFDTGNPARSFGIGPQFSFDTASENATGAGKTQAGLAAVYFDAASQFFQWGGLLTYRTDIAGSSSRPDTSVLAAQPFYFFQLGKYSPHNRSISSSSAKATTYAAHRSGCSTWRTTRTTYRSASVSER